MIYVPYFEDGNCVVVVSSDVIRVYQVAPTHNSTISYRDYYIKSNYIYNDGVATFSSYSTLPVCRSADTVTTEYFYRNDLDSIMIIFIIMVIFIIIVPLKIVTRLFRRLH